ncbi:ArnT family glycosyltransferase [Xanthomonas indica]|uniref:Glycosyltransferase family 39 protein n=1 Tax=Xanthomonas indica TaxID=2912242 RepID=A0AAU8I5T8_9XANT|nr:glycosyltransferase family 39 protein [Xanthomonas indica]MCI2261196.1 glycosyltransferase family 39 protein [Xanthomonas indica]
MRALLRSPAVAVALLACTLALALLGARGIWDADEGRYTNVALNMLHSGDWLTPRRSEDVAHWTKPPLTYWAIAASVAAFGPSPWAARLPSALAYLLCVLLVWRLAARLFPERPTLPAQAALLYATMLAPFGAAQWISTDFLLAACETLAVWAFVEARAHPPGQGKRWIAAMWAGFALAFMTKGPPGLLPLPALLLFNAVTPGPPRRALQLSGIALFTVLALPWYLAVIHGHPGLLQYFVGDEVVKRVASDAFGRNAQWYGWAVAYAPILVLGTLPWTPALARWVWQLPRQLRQWWRTPALRLQQAAPLLLTLWLLLPLLVLCLSRSRLPLYVLPLFVPLALLAAWQRAQEGRAPWRWPWLLGWCGLLLALELAPALLPTHKDAGAWAQAIAQRAGTPVREVVFVEDMARYGLRLELGAQVRKIRLDPLPDAPRFGPEYDADLSTVLRQPRAGRVWVCKQEVWPQVAARIAAQGAQVQALGPPYRGRVLFRVRPGSVAAAADRDR